MSTSPTGSAAPVSFWERLEHIDIIRGIALLGVLIMNLHFWFRAPMLRYHLEGHPWGGFWNVSTDWFLAIMVEGKAMTTFAMLFAVGLAIQMERAEERGLSYWKFGFRRLGALFAFGLLHIFLVWNGDILHNYAMVGLLSLLFLRRKLKTILIWLGSLWGLAAVAVIVFSVIQMRGPAPKPNLPLAQMQANLQEMIQIRGAGTWLAEFHFRLREYMRIFGPPAELFIGLDVFIKFLVGLAIWKSGILRNPSAHLPRIRQFFAWTFSVGLFFVALNEVGQAHHTWAFAHWKQARFFLPIMGFAQVYGLVLMSLGLTSGVLLLLQRETWHRLLKPFASVGRMALSSYLTQSLFMTFLFFGWGLHLYNKLGPFAGLCVSLTFFGLQVLLCRWWLKRFQFGPMEWVWRCITYGKLQPMRVLPVLAPNEPALKAPEPA